MKDLPVRVIALFSFLCVMVNGRDLANLPLRKTGELLTRSSQEISASSWSIGCETLDRDFASYIEYKKYLGPLGAKSARFQAGWAKTEKIPGKYDWAWLDEIVNDAKAQGVNPWLQLSYGNPAYPGGGGPNIGDAAPSTPEAKAAWDSWARSLVRRYQDRVTAWEIWNEPDLSKKINLNEYIDLFIRTAEIIRAEHSAGRVYALSLAHKTDYSAEFLRELSIRGKIHLVDDITFHGYPHNPDDLTVYQEMLSVVTKYAHPIGLIQGETGAPSDKTTGALRDHVWTENTQTKWNLRRMLAHHFRGVPVNLFTLSDFFYPNGINTKGLLKIRQDLTVIGAKPAYSAAQHVFSLFDTSLVPTPMIPTLIKGSQDGVGYTYINNKSQRPLIVYWLNSKPPEDTDDFFSIDLEVNTIGFEYPVAVDLKSGFVYEIEARSHSTSDSTTIFQNVPIYDSPIVIISRTDIKTK
jgi:hypothetical protein